LSYLPLARQAAFRCRISPVAQSALFCRVTRTFVTPVLFVAGIIGTRHLQCSATELKLLSQLVGIEPTTVGSEVARAITTPQTFLRFFVTSPCACFSPSNTHTRSVFTETLSCSPSHKQEQSREELALTGLADSNRRPCGPTRRSNRKLHHPGRLASGYFTLFK